ncbi:MAG: DUF1858 domain-containing protein [Aminipila sp.]
MTITKDATIGEVIRNHPEAAEVLQEFGMGCLGCPSAQSETLEEAASVHGIDVENMIKKLNEI